MRLVTVSLIAIGTIACAMVIVGWRYLGFMLGLLLVAIAGVLVYQVARSVSCLRNQSGALRQGAIAAENHYVDVLKQVVKFMEAREKHKPGHSERVGELSETIALQWHHA